MSSKSEKIAYYIQQSLYQGRQPDNNDFYIFSRKELAAGAKISVSTFDKNRKELEKYFSYYYNFKTLGNYLKLATEKLYVDIKYEKGKFMFKRNPLTLSPEYQHLWAQPPLIKKFSCDVNDERHPQRTNSYKPICDSFPWSLSEGQIQLTLSNFNSTNTNQNSVIKKISKWEPENFELEMTTHWSFPKRGDWATHDAKWRGNWSPYIPRNIMLRYSQKGDLVLDQFAGGGTTLVEAKLLNRNIVGVDINDVALARCKEKINFEHEGANGKVYLYKGDARHLDFIPNNSIDLICTHPPYANIIQYSDDIIGDLSHFNIQDFLEEMKAVAAESFRVLKNGKFCAVLMGDTRQKGHMIPLSFNVMKVFEDAGFKLKETIIKEQHNCKATGYWKTNSIKYNFLLIAHEYLFIFKK